MRRLGFVRGSVLALLPLGALLVGPAIAAVTDADSFEVRRFFLSALPTILPLVALAAVVAVAYRRTHSLKLALAAAAAGFGLAVLGGLVFVIVTFPYGH